MESVPVKHPKRVIHCSDGVLEEYSTDDEDDQRQPVETQVIEPKTLTWVPWMWYQTTWIGSKTLAACDYVGESLANFFGITASKYQLEINEYYRMKENEAEVKKKEDLEMGGWTERNCNNLIEPTPSETVQNDERF